MVQLTRLEATHLRARAALAASSDAGSKSHREALIGEAARDARKIAGEKMPWSSPLAALLQAGVAAARGDKARALALLPQAAKGLDEAGMALYATAARWRQGKLGGGDEGKRLVAEAEAWLAKERIKAPAKMIAMLAPGFGD
jgi:eukaryotic-like serine/threonine-protein kinase